MKATNKFKQVIKNYLDNRAQADDTRTSRNNSKFGK